MTRARKCTLDIASAHGWAAVLAKPQRTPREVLDAVEQPAVTLERRIADEFAAFMRERGRR
jgi:hypothetical protein